MNNTARADEKIPAKLHKALLIDLGAHFGGVENYLVSLAHLFEGEVELYALCVLPELANRLSAIGVRTVLLPILGGALKPLRFLLALAVLPWVLLRHRIAIVQVNGFLEATLMLPSRLLGRRAVYTRHGPFETENYRWYRDPLKYLPRALARISVHLATDVVCVSETVGLGVKQIRPPVPVVVIPNWLAGHDDPQPVRAGTPLNLVCASRLERYKGIHLVIEAIRGLEGVRLTVVGDGPYRPELEQLAAGLPITFAGFQKDMAPFYQAADIFLMPSLGPEGLPMSSIEAMGRGLPCIFSDLPVHQEITAITAGTSESASDSDSARGAILFRSGDVPSLRTAIQTLASSHELRARLSAAAYQIVHDRYTATSVKSKYLAVFRAA